MIIRRSYTWKDVFCTLVNVGVAVFQLLLFTAALLSFIAVGIIYCTDSWTPVIEWLLKK